MKVDLGTKGLMDSGKVLNEYLRRFCFSVDP